MVNNINNGIEENGKMKKSIYAEETILSTKQMLLYSVGILGFGIIAALLSGFVLKYAVSILGLPPFFVGSVYSLMLVLSAFAGPFFGGLSDKVSLQSKIGIKYGRRKPFMIIGAPIFTICAIWFWSIPPCQEFNTLDPSTAMQFFIVMALYRIFESCAMQPYMAMIPEISRDESNRIKLSSWSMMFSMIGGMLGMFIPMIFLAGAASELENIAENSDKLWAGIPSSPGEAIYNQLQILVIIIAVIYLICIAIMVISTKVPKMIENLDSDEEKGSMNVLKTLKEPFADRNALKYIIGVFLTGIPTTSFMYLIFNFLDEILHLDSFMYYLAIGLIIIMMGISLTYWGKISEKIGLKNSYLRCLYLSVIGFLMLQFTNLQSILSEFILIYQIMGLAALAFMLFSVVGAMIFPRAMLSDIIDQSEERTGKSQSGNYNGASSFLGTLGSACSMMICTFFLDIYGKDAITGYVIVFLIGFCLSAAAIPIFKKIVIVGKKLEN
ncbi:MAG: MFS transporter [archaeon]|nr:MFS transporter [archaeon]